MTKPIVLVAVLALAFTTAAASQDVLSRPGEEVPEARPRQQPVYPPEIPGARSEIYKRVGDTELNLWIYDPPGHTTADRRPAIVFFFGGGWRQGTPRQFRPHSQYLASRGMVAAMADYRVGNRHGVRVKECVTDAKSAMRWLRANAGRLGIDPHRIAAGGGSAGGHLAVSLATLPGHDDPGDDRSVSPRPDALALFNPAVILAPVADGGELPAERMAALEERLGAPPPSLSPYHHVQAGLPPTIIFHGREDRTVPYRSVAMFSEKMQQQGNRCELVGYDGASHGFFNYGRGDGTAYDDTLARLDSFLVSLGWLTPGSTPTADD
jgi:acetyl esterase